MTGAPCGSGDAHSSRPSDLIVTVVKELCNLIDYFVFVLLFGL